MKIKLIRRFLCYLGHHKIIIGFGWSRNKRFDTCIHCKFFRWVEDLEGSKKINLNN